ncbi:hypothetical protein ONZ51_g7443 [Trametes cubensis]|uniref:Uncharacterized protein n=1 Tax=Trametes cubensis TaxID=1111947 RepID=A0AAD7TSM8_9APHY|nr:hypothetical protein ONZ51_g7443 [Trametes cubensis]
MQERCINRPINPSSASHDGAFESLPPRPSTTLAPSGSSTNIATAALGVSPLSLIVLHPASLPSLYSLPTRFRLPRRSPPPLLPLAPPPTRSKHTVLSPSSLSFLAIYPPTSKREQAS